MITRYLDSWCTIHPSSISSSGFQYLAAFVMVDVRRHNKSHDTFTSYIFILCACVSFFGTNST